tara:strand:- start:276 stop:437 length:162 start_codon:yes stop_codon:yes gene_type:complete
MTFFLVWFQLLNNNLTHYVIDQYPTLTECEAAKKTASVLVTTSSIAIHCFEVK